MDLRHTIVMLLVVVTLCVSTCALALWLDGGTILSTRCGGAKEVALDGWSCADWHPIDFPTGRPIHAIMPED